MFQEEETAYERPTDRRQKGEKNAKGPIAGNSTVKEFEFSSEENLGPLKGRGRTRALEPLM